MKNIISAFKIVFKDPLFIFLGLSLSLNVLAIYYFIFSQSTTFKVYFDSNTAFYNWASIISSVAISLLFGLVLTFIIWQWRNKFAQNPAHLGNSLISGFFGAISTGCPVCGAFLISLLGIGGGLAAFPFQGLEIKIVSLGLLGFASFSLAKSIADEKCDSCARFPMVIKTWLPAFVGFVLLFLVAYLPAISHKLDFGFTFQKRNQTAAINPIDSSKIDSSAILDSINPIKGYALNVAYGNLGQQLLAVGAIDFNKMKTLYEEAGQPLTPGQIKILTEGSSEKIKITPENSYFLLNFFWALGLANKNVILDEGPMVQYGGKDQIENFASTGGWTLGTKRAAELYSKFEIIKLNPDQQKVLEEFAFNSYRPCCSNPVGFPDCNHGMAALAFGELMASQGASADEIFEAYKYLNSFWFPQTYFDIAAYFKAKEGKDWAEADSRLVAGKDYSTPQGWQNVRQWLKQNGILEEAPSGGGSCGV